MRTPTTAWLAAFAAVAALATAVAGTSGAQHAPAGGAAPAHGEHAGAGPHTGHGAHMQERYLYVSTIAQSPTDPDFIAVIGADPRRRDFGKIVNRVDMPNVGDELHHYGYSHDRKRLLVPGLFSSRLHVFDVKGDGRRLALKTVNDQLAAKSGYVVPHGVMAHGMSRGRALVTMIGSASASTLPGGMVEIDDRTGAFVRYFGPGPAREAGQAAPKYMYDFEALPEANRGISTTFGAPAKVAVGIDPNGLGNEVYVWNLRRREVIQTADLGASSGALMVHWIGRPGVRRAFINAPGTSAIWLADDDDRDGVYDFQQVLAPEDGLALPLDMLVSHDDRYLYVSNWFRNTVQQFDIRNPLEPVLKSTVSVPHPNMLRLSRDNRRLYVTNSLLTSWDNDADFGPARNDEYGIWLCHVDTRSGRLKPFRRDGSAWVSFENVRKKTTTGPAGPHLILFDPSIPLAPGEH
jgi:methanethiol oxidase